MVTPYITVKNYAQDEFIEKRSKFIGYIKPVSTEKDALNFINEIKAKHKDATHNVYAYIIKDENVIRYNDDGEPQGTAGIPVLQVLQKNDVTDVAVVVTRYFGGVLLGGGGLVRAYGHTAKIALDKAQKIKMCVGVRLKVYTDYNTIGKILHEFSKRNLEIEDSNYAENITLTLCIPIDDVEEFTKLITEISFGKNTVEKVEEIFFAVKI